MDTQALDQRIARRSAAIYLPISVGAALSFALAASLVGEFAAVARIGGAVWVGTLTLIVSMPLVTARVKRSLRGSGAPR